MARRVSKVEKAPRKIRTTTRTEEIDDAAADEAADGSDSLLTPQMHAALAQITEDGGSVVIKKRVGDTARFAWLKRQKPDEFSIDAIGELHGGGEYLILFYDDENTLLQKSIHLVDASVKGRVQDSPLASAPSDLTGFLAVMQAQITAANERHEKLMERLMASQPSEEKVIEKLKAMRDVFGGGNQGVTPDTVLQLVMKGMEIAADARENTPDGSPGLVGMMEKALVPVLGPMLQRMIASGAPAAPVPALTGPAAPSPAAVSAAPASPSNGHEEADPMQIVKMAIKSALPMLVFQASQQKDPALYAEFLLDNLNPKFYGLAAAFLAKPDLIAELCALAPTLTAEIEKHRPWFNSLQQELIAQLHEHLNPPALDAPRQPAAES